jgi:hypothetical protein
LSYAAIRCTLSNLCKMNKSVITKAAISIRYPTRIWRKSHPIYVYIYNIYLSVFVCVCVCH